MKTRILILLAFTFYGLILNAQTKEDSLAVEKACRDYIEGWGTADVERVANGVSPELCKRTIGKDKDGLSYSSQMSASLLKFVTEMNKDGIRVKDLKPDEKLNPEVIIYDITGDFANAKTVCTKYGFFDYCQLAKFEGEWKIFNVMYGFMPQE
jgi:hypothetical protein